VLLLITRSGLGCQGKYSAGVQGSYFKILKASAEMLLLNSKNALFFKLKSVIILQQFKDLI